MKKLKKLFFFWLLGLLFISGSIYAQSYDGPTGASIQKPSCSDQPYSVTLSWTDSESGTYLVNLSTDSDFFNVWEKVVDLYSTPAPAGFENFDPNGPALTLNPVTTYYVRVIRSPTSDSTISSFSVPRCPQPTLQPTSSPSAGSGESQTPLPNSPLPNNFSSPPGSVDVPYNSLGNDSDDSTLPNGYEYIDTNSFKKNRVTGIIILILVITGIVWLVYWLIHRSKNPTDPPPPPPPSVVIPPSPPG